MNPPDDITRREFVGATAAAVTLVGVPAAEADSSTPPAGQYSLTINGQNHDLTLDQRVTLLDLLRERLHITGPKKGCDHGQCGACTVLSNGRRINSCLTLAIQQEGNQITTIEGLAQGAELHPMQAAFLKNDGFQCGFCTSGQICSAIAMLAEYRAGMPSAVSAVGSHSDLNDAEIRERMAGNICRCGAYPGIVAAIREVHRA